MTTLTKIMTAIKTDPENLAYTAQGWEPLVHILPNATILIISQAPGRIAQQTATYFNDASGDRLRTWMGVTREQFYHSDRIAVMPLDFYYPGKGKSGDLPPRKGFADKWHQPLLALMPNVQLTLLVGQYAIKAYLGKNRRQTLTATVQNYADYLPDYFPIVHPSPLNYGWQKRNPWFQEQVVPELQDQVRQALD
ncbi:uracil-DNA glycosylase family protein [Lapidilactobacillus gannanensis]|jgi:uracil-DNA glycosylase|uniref:Uracil-DNA glycosylase family protein n=1 Tax=Lapidilactobacillus gannanensis TaxID=2486002 RepID=A0ABW4BQP2_9LACO|nr:uracil-DNA glycosylase family protein [Lapidilactobacillus gannanensis]MCH4056922.1 uracil-DNA glycosylase family protein [Lactobacillaceae bacterium]